MRRAATLVALLAAVVLATAAVPARAQSPFALRNIGQNVWLADAHVTGRGGWGMTVADTMQLGFKNIAGLADNPFVGIHLTAFGERADGEQNGERRRTYRTFAPDLRVSLPLKPGRFALTAGFKARRATQYETRAAATWEVDEGTLSGFEQFQRSGSLLEVPLGASFRVNRQLALGAALNVVRGSINQTRFAQSLTLDRGDGVAIVSPYLISAEDQQETYDGTSFTASILLSHLGPLSLGAAITPAFDLALDRKIALQGVSARRFESFELRWPAEYQVGGEVRLDSRWRIGADYERQDFRGLTGLPEWEADLEDERTVSFGVERTLARERHGGFSNLPLRLGARLRHWAYRVGDAPVDETVVSIGTGFALEGGRGQLDLALSRGFIGALEDNGVATKYWRLTVSVTGLERWW